MCGTQLVCTINTIIDPGPSILGSALKNRTKNRKLFQKLNIIFRYGIIVIIRRTAR